MTTSFFKLHDVNDIQVHRAVKIWLLTGLAMIFMQIVIGGVTRLTGSGLSITRWEIVTGVVPPLSESAWQEAFDLYKQTPQYQKINEGMDMRAFKFIYFWEYFHRLWARLMFFVFVFPFAWFLWRNMMPRHLVPRLLIVVALAGLEGFFGWAMVASGLIKRPWVNAYNLTLHLCMALIIFAYLMWTVFMAYRPMGAVWQDKKSNKWAWGIFGLAFFQIALGAMMSGTKAGLFFPTWPDMNGGYLPSVLMDGSQWRMESFLEYDSNPFMPALIQFLHRNTGYVLTGLILYWVWTMGRAQIPDTMRNAHGWLAGAVLLQVLLGILTVVNCKMAIPVDLGVAHQGGAVFLLSTILWVCYLVSAKPLASAGRTKA